MISALFYLQFNSVKNRTVMRFKRLKQPKYLIGLVFGAIYFYFYFFRFLLMPRGRMGGASSMANAIPTDPIFYESIGALILFGIVLLAWVVPHQRAALAFTEAEVAFLFPAPVSRKSLIHFKLMRSQLAILFTVLFLTLLSNRFGGAGRGLIRAAGWWVILLTLNLHFLASSFALTRLMDRGLSNWKRRVAVLLLVALAVGGVVAWAVRSTPELTSGDLANVRSLSDYFDQVMVSGPLPYLLYPFRLVVKPYLAADWISFLNAIWPALLLMLAHYIWVIRADVAFEEASVEASKKLAEKVAAMRAGNRGALTKFKKKRAPFNLQPRGWPLIALLWKNLINAGGAFTARTWISIAVALIVMALALRGTMARSNWTMLVGMFTAMVGAWALLIGPQIVRQDFRQDLPNMDLLKGFPLRGWQVALGQILAPTIILTGVHWLLLVIAVACACAMPAEIMRIPPLLALAIGAGLAMVLPGLNLISLLIPNGAVLLFPAWFQTGKDAPTGIEATGQRIVFALGQFLAYGLSLIPAVAAFFGVFLLTQFFAGDAVAVIAASFATALVLLAEAGLGVMLLGSLFERFDLSKETAN